jgi:hypothetical protein
VNREKAKNMLKIVFGELRKQGAELLTYQATFMVLKAALKDTHPDFAPLADAALTRARVSPAVLENVRRLFDEPLEKFLQQVSQAETEEEVEKLLLDMPTNNWVN